MSVPFQLFIPYHPVCFYQFAFYLFSGLVFTNVTRCILFLLAANLMHDLIIEIGDDLSEDVFDTSSYVRCAEVPGVVGAGATVSVQCADEAVGRFVIVRIEGKNEQLTLCEVEVYGVQSEYTHTYTFQHGQNVKYVDVVVSHCSNTILTH